jgi:DNA-binding transcriptional ArsR family regulator
LAALFPELDRTTVLQHLRVLERAGLVIGRKVGRERHLYLAPLPSKRIYDRWISKYARAAVDLLDPPGQRRTVPPSRPGYQGRNSG